MDGDVFVSIDEPEPNGYGDVGCIMTGFYFWGDLYIWDVEYTTTDKA